MEYTSFDFKVEDKIAYVGLGKNSKKSLTVFTIEILQEMDALIDDLYKLQKKKSIRGVVFHSVKKDVFAAGVDISIINEIKTEKDAYESAQFGQNLYSKIEDLKVATVACIDGPCLGGGLELALSCNSIICSDSSKTIFALPEVQLGILPGLGGTYRLPRRIGLPKALDLILSGKRLDCKRAMKYGIVDEIYAKETLLSQARIHLKKYRRKTMITRLVEKILDNVFIKKYVFHKARESVLKKTKGFYLAPLKILDIMEGGMMKGRTSYMNYEAKGFGQLAVSDQSKNFIHIFHMTEFAKKFVWRGYKGKVIDFKRGASLGAGTMGGGISWLLANMGLMPIMKDISKESLELGLKQAAGNFKRALKRKKITGDVFNRKIRSICPRLDFVGFERVDLVIEATPENMELKKKVFLELESNVRKDAILTSNTSSLCITEMCSDLKDNSRFAGLHFFNPVHKMPLVEIITHDGVSDKTVASLHSWCLKAKKFPVVVKDGPGFLVNRILAPYMIESMHLLKEGVSFSAIEKAATEFGMPMGPFRLMDEVGIDVAAKVCKVLHQGLGARFISNGIVENLVGKDILGKKNSKGFYIYDSKGKEDGVNSKTKKLLPDSFKKMDEVEIQLRVFLPMINEAAMILEEGIVSTPLEVDMGLIFGIGFPPFRGGLLRYADHEGVNRIVGALEKFADEVSEDRYAPSNYIKNLIKEKSNFYS